MRGSVQLSQLLQCLPQGGGTALRSSERGGASVPSSTACTVVHCTYVAHRPSISQVPIDLVVEREASIIAAPKSRPTSTPFPRERLRVRASPRAKFSCFYLAKQIRLSPVQGEPHSSVHSSLPRARSRPSLSSRRVSTSPRHHGARTHICIFFFFLCGQGRSTSAPAGLLSSTSP